MLGLLENASFLVYIYSIYGGIAKLVDFFAFISTCVVVLMLIAYTIVCLLDGVEEYKKMFSFVPTKTIIGIWLFLLTFNMLLPEKKYLPYIISASPVAKTIINSYNDGIIKQTMEKVQTSAENGTIHKVDQIVDKSLDIALRYLDDNSTK